MVFLRFGVPAGRHDLLNLLYGQSRRVVDGAGGADLYPDRLRLAAQDAARVADYADRLCRTVPAVGARTALHIHLPLLCQRALHYYLHRAGAQRDPQARPRGVQGLHRCAAGTGAGAVRRILPARIGSARAGKLCEIPEMVQVVQLLTHPER